MGKGLILALDIGTSSVKCALFDVQGSRIPSTTSQKPTSLLIGADGRAELEPFALLKVTKSCVSKTLSTSMGSIIAWSTCAFWHSLMGVDGAGRPLTPIYTWADSRCREDAAHLRSILSEKAVHARTGCMLRSSYWPAKLRWLARTRPTLFKSVRYWLSPAEWILWQLGILPQCSISMASGTGMLDVHKLHWDSTILRVCKIRKDQLSPLGDFPTLPSPKSTLLFPKLKDSLCFPAIGDGASSNLGSDATSTNLAAINIGTSAAVRVIIQKKKVNAPLGIFLYRVDSHRYLVGGAISNAGNVRQWCLRQLALSPSKKDMLIQNWSPVPNPHLTVLPFWVNERAPTWPEDLPGVIAGLTAATTANELFQAITDSTYLRLAQIADLLPNSRTGSLKFIVSGGVNKSVSLLQRLSNVLGKTLIVSDEPEASMRGAAIFALNMMGIKPIRQKFKKLVKPEKAKSLSFLRARNKQARLENLLQSKLCSN